MTRQWQFFFFFFINFIKEQYISHCCSEAVAFIPSFMGLDHSFWYHKRNINWRHLHWFNNLVRSFFCGFFLRVLRIFWLW